jgi:phage gp46-like protein
MTDAAIIFNPALNVYDVAVQAGDLQADNGLKTAIILSLLLDRPALPGDVLPDPRSAYRGGWWGTAFLPPLNGKPDFYGSRLWLLKRAVQTPDTLVKAQNYAMEALEWMLLDGVVGSLTVVCTYPALGVMNISPQFGQAGNKNLYDVLWSFER